jgi:hypothetical protein
MSRVPLNMVSGPSPARSAASGLTRGSVNSRPLRQCCTYTRIPSGDSPGVRYDACRCHVVVGFQRKRATNWSPSSTGAPPRPALKSA